MYLDRFIKLTCNESKLPIYIDKKVVTYVRPWGEDTMVGLANTYFVVTESVDTVLRLLGE